MKLNKVIALRIEPELFNILSNKAEKNKETLSELIRRTLRSTFDIPVGYKCSHIIALFPEGVSPCKPISDCGCDMVPFYDVGEIMTYWNGD